MKECKECKQLQPLDNFYQKKYNNSGHENRCKNCYKEWKRSYRLANQDKIRAQNKRRNPGWDIDRYNEYVELQGNRCAICGTDEPGLSDWCCDHCHTENKARGLLCVQCNAGLGYFKDNPEFLQSAIDYLKKWQ